MGTKFYKNEKFQKIFYAVLYFLLAVAFVISGIFIFQKNYYTNIYVSGSSMMPTLIGNTSERVHYGISDNHDRAKKSLNRFDVVITYYPWNVPDGETDTVYKIKRVWGFPGETISMTFSESLDSFIFTVKNPIENRDKLKENPDLRWVGKIKYEEMEGYSNPWKVAEFTADKKVFCTHVDELRTFEVTLDQDKQEYFLMGDNWGHSTDSYSHRAEAKRITFDNIQGRVVAIQGTAKVKGDTLYDKKKIRAMYRF